MFLRKDKGGTSIGGYEWPEDGSVCEVDAQTGAALLAIEDGGFTQADGPEADAGEDASAKPKRTRKPASTEA
jgi:hypothetical protein